MIRVGFLVAGTKGWSFFDGFRHRCETAFVCSYRVKGTRDDSLDRIMDRCSEGGYSFLRRKELTSEILNRADLIFVVGWQFILEEVDERYVILHDSLLPRYRGFAPTVTALINGEREIGVTALRPSPEVDRGLTYGQAKVWIDYPMKLQKALELVDGCYLQIASDVLERFENKTLVATVQDESLATYSIWRDEKDYFINWSWPAEKVVRFVDAVGWPFSGAKTLFRGLEIIIDEVEVGNDLHFEDRHSGKIWALRDGMPEIICGCGIVKIVSAHHSDGCKVEFDRLRERVG